MSNITNSPHFVIEMSVFTPNNHIPTNMLSGYHVVQFFQFRANVSDVCKPHHDDIYLLRWLKGLCIHTLICLISLCSWIELQILKL